MFETFEEVLVVGFHLLRRESMGLVTEINENNYFGRTGFVILLP